MPVVKIDANGITSWDTFHDVFKHAFGFPDYYGHNMDAWIDCMKYVDDPQLGMTKLHGTATNPVVVQIEHIQSLPKDIYDALIECTALVNWERLNAGKPAILVLAFNR